MASEMSDLISQLEDFGFYEVALPFILIFTLFFAILQKIELFGENGKNFNAVISMVMAFLVVRTQSIVEVMNTFLPQISLIALIFVVVLILIGILLGPAAGGWSGLPLGLGLIITITGVGIAFYGSSAPLGIELPDWLQFTVGDRNILLGILLFFLFISFITSEPGKPGQTWSNLFKSLGKLPQQLGRSGKR